MSNVINLTHDELPLTIKKMIPEIHKVIMDKIEEVSNNSKYKKLKECKDFNYKKYINAIRNMKNNNIPIGVITKKDANNFTAMIQITGHITNPNKTDSEKLFHSMMVEVYRQLTHKMKEDFRVELSNDDFKEHNYEGFDIYTSPEIAKSIWKFNYNSKSGAIKKYQESEEYFNEGWFLASLVTLVVAPFVISGLMVVALLISDKQRSNKFKKTISKILDINEKDVNVDVYFEAASKEFNNLLKSNKDIIMSGFYLPNKTNTTIRELKKSDIRFASLCTNYKTDNPYAPENLAFVSLLPSITGAIIEIKNEDAYLKKLNSISPNIKFSFETIDLPFDDNGGGWVYAINSGLISRGPDSEINNNLAWEKEVGEFKSKYKIINLIMIMTAKQFLIDNFKKTGLMESAEPEYNTDMTEVQAKNTLKTLSQSLINDFENNKNKKITQYTANIYANIITKNLLPKWSKGFSKFRITLDSYQSFLTFEFITPKMGQDFVSRFINGRESLNGLVHRSPEIRVKMSPRIFHTMKDANDPYNFFKAAIKYYDSQVEKAGNKLMAEVMRMGHNMKYLIANSKLSGLVTYPLTLLFIFNDVDMNNKDTFKITKNDIDTINKFVKNISSRYAAPEKEKKQIVEDIKSLVKELKESCEFTDTIKDIGYLPKAVEQLLFNGYNKEILESSKAFIEEQINKDWNPSYPVKQFKESWGVKKLKKIPKDLVPYIQIETESIKDANDKMILSSYTLGKIEIVEWYIELLTVGSNKYIVPHSKPYLETIRSQLLECYKKIMGTVVPKTYNTIDIKYPAGYEG